MRLIAPKCMLVPLVLIFINCKQAKTGPLKPSVDAPSCQLNLVSDMAISKPDGVFRAHRTLSTIKIDCCNNDKTWATADWYDMNYAWMGKPVDSMDYQGRFKLAWNSQHLYVLIEIIDEHLNPTLADGQENYWKGDYVEVFIDEDQSGGIHKFNHQAFAYHVTTEGHTIDKNKLQKTIFLDNHIDVERSNEGHKYLWEMAISLFDNQFDENSTTNIPVKIFNDKSIGFSIAYGDNDGANSRENFMG